LTALLEFDHVNQYLNRVKKHNTARTSAEVSPVATSYL